MISNLGAAAGIIPEIEYGQPEHVLRKIHHCTFWPKISQ